MTILSVAFFLVASAVASPDDGYTVKRTAGSVWQDGLFVGGGSHGVMAYAPSHLEWVINRNDLFDGRVALCDYTPHEEVMRRALSVTNGIPNVRFLESENRYGNAAGQTSSLSAAFLRVRFWNGVGWYAPSTPLTTQTLDLRTGELDTVQTAPSFAPHARLVVPREPDVIALSLDDPKRRNREAIVELARPEDSRLIPPPEMRIDGDVVSFEQRLPYGDSYAVALCVPGTKAFARGLVASVRTTCPREVFVAVRASRSAKDPRADAVAAVRAAAKAGYAALRERTASAWRDFWAQGAVADFTSEPAVDRTFKQALFNLAGQFGPVPMPALNGLTYGPIDASEAGLRSNAYTLDQNVQIPMMAFLPLNRCSFVRAYAGTFARMLPEMRRRTRELFGEKVRGVYAALTLNPDGKEHPVADYRYSFCGSAYAGLVLAKAWQYGRDRTLLKETYPILREFVRFYVSTMSRGADGRYHFLWSVPPEIFSLTRDELCIVACLKTCLEVAVEASALLGDDVAERAVWQELLAHYPEPARQSGGGWWCGPDIPDSHYMFGGHLFYPFFPAESFTDRTTAERTLDYAYRKGVEMGWTLGRPHPKHDWCAFYTGVARLRLKDAADGWAAVTEFLDLFGKPNGLFSHNAVIVTDATDAEIEENLKKAPPAYLSDYTGKTTLRWRGNVSDLTPNREAKKLAYPVLEGSAAFLFMASETLLQGEVGRIRIFPAVPPGFTGRFERLLARGGVVVSAEMRDGKVVGCRVETGGGERPEVTCPTDPNWRMKW